MPRIKLTDSAVRSLKPPAAGQATYWDSTLAGFGLRLARGGAKTWVVQYRSRSDRRVKRLAVGRYPLVSLADARAAAKEQLAAVTKGQDPAAERRTDREAATFGEVAREFVEDAKAKGRRTWPEIQRVLDHDVLPAWRTRHAKDITARDVRDLLDAIVARGAKTQANRTFAIVRRLFNWAAAPDRAYIPQFHNPCRGLERPAPERQRDRVLTADELRAVWAALTAVPAPVAALVKLLLLTAQRIGEVRTIAWADVDLEAGWWTIPAERAKNGLAHRVPLSPTAVSLLRELRDTNAGSHVFPTPHGSASGVFERVYKSIARLRKASGVADFTPHDLRRTTASWMTSLGVSRLTVSKLLNHVERGVTAIYDRHSYDREKQEAVNLWATRLAEIVSGARARVVPLRAS